METPRVASVYKCPLTSVYGRKRQIEVFFSFLGGGGVLGWLVLMLAIYLTIWIYIWFMVDHKLGAP